jgi:hypothetical protein
VRRPVEVVEAFQIEIVTFGHTVAPVPLVIVIAEFVVAIFPNMRADCLELNVVQSVAESAPVVVADARAREIPEPEIERPFGVPEMKPSLLLKVVQSVPVSAPVVVALAFPIENTHVRLLYVSGPTAERAVSPIFVATTPERVVRFVFVSARLPERVEIFAVLVAV